ncbi:T9SS type A sorting domain-containing protein [Flavobacterium sp.]|uniref:T9SS type A sorting domain-containing protein n=1 Tax=Flavobacterium sp. TaxID=239 RepID=UPI0037514547
MKKFLHVLVIVFSITTFAQAPALEWVKQVGSNGNEQLNLNTIDNNGNVFTAGTYTNSGNLVITKYDTNGLVLWTKTIGGNVKPADIKVDPVGNIILVGEFSSLVDFDPSSSAVFNLGIQNVTSPLFNFILKLDTSGNFIYAKEIGGTPRSICIDAGENIYLTGTFSNSKDFDPSPTITNNFTSFDGYSIFITKLNNNAQFVWNKVIGKTTASTSGFGYCGGNKIMNDANNNVVVTGHFSDDVDFDPGTGTAAYTSGGTAHTRNPFVLKLNVAGDFVWAKFFNSNEMSESNDMDFDSNGNIYTTGTARGFMDFDSGSGTLYLSHSYQVIPYVSKMDTNGNIIWAKQIFATDNGVDLNSIQIDDNGNIFSFGRFKHTVSYNTTTGSGTATTAGFTVYNVFLTALNASGNLVSFNHFGGSDMTFPNKMILKNNNIYVSGFFSNNVDFDFSATVNSLTSVGMRDNYIAKYNISNFLETKSFEKPSIISLYPNPTTSQINLSFENNLENTSLKIISITGQTVFEKRDISESSLILDVSNLSNGTYVIQVIDNNYIRTSKFIKQ